MRLSLRTRFVGGLMLVVVLLSAGFYTAVYQFIEVLESELLERTLVRELDAFSEYYARDHDFVWPSTDGMQAHAVRVNQPGGETLPTPLLTWEPNQLGELEWEGRVYYASRRDVDDARLYMMLDIEYVENLEERMVTLAGMLVLAGLLIATFVGLLLSRLVTRPVSRLSALVTGLNPAERGIQLRRSLGDPEIGAIAAAFDRYLEKLDTYVAREQAFTDDASHELRTPLAIILSAIPLLQEDAALGDAARERLARIERAALQMQKLLEALLYLAREDGGLAQDTCQLGDILQEAADAHREAVAAKSLSLRCEILAPQTVRAPGGMVVCVINNLIANAVQHTSDGHIDLRLEPGLIVVQDTGNGIAEADLAHIFERRYRGAQSRGLGLGLYIVKRICDRLGWSIQARSGPGAGAHFEIRLPPQG